jgi:hypothetical protein
LIDKDEDDNQQGPIIIQEVLSQIDIERNSDDFGFGGSKLLVKKQEQRQQLPFILPEGHNVPIWKIIGQFAS